MPCNQFYRSCNQFDQQCNDQHMHYPGEPLIPGEPQVGEGALRPPDDLPHRKPGWLQSLQIKLGLTVDLHLLGQPSQPEDRLLVSIEGLSASTVQHALDVGGKDLAP